MGRSREKEKRGLIARMMAPDRNPGQPGSPDQRSRLCKWLKSRGLKIAIGWAVLIIAAGSFIYYHNKFANLKHAVKDARAKTEVALQHRENLVPALIITITDFITHENEIFIHAADARAKSVGNKVQSSKSKAGQSGDTTPGGDWDDLASKFFGIAERYPELRTGEPFQLLMSKIADAEMEIFNKRVEYNTVVRQYNIKITTFPSNIFAGIFRVKPKPYFQWEGKPEWVSTMHESRRTRTTDILEKWRTRLLGEE